jgi:competence protein ComEA
MSIKKIAYLITIFLVFSLFASGLYAEDRDKINLNSATIEELAKIPGLNQELAKKLVDAREENGEFVDMEELLDIEGIDETMLNQLEKYLKIEEQDVCNC